MYQTGDTVVYGVHGVCCVMGFEKQLIGSKRENYMVLEPRGQEGSRFYVPADNPVAMDKIRPIMTRIQMQELLETVQQSDDDWISDENRRKQMYRELIASSDSAALMKMVRTLYLHQADCRTRGKKVHLCDENFLRDAEKMLSSEISVVMELSPEQARIMLRKALKGE